MAPERGQGKQDRFATRRSAGSNLCHGQKEGNLVKMTIGDCADDENVHPDPVVLSEAEVEDGIRSGAALVGSWRSMRHRLPPPRDRTPHNPPARPRCKRQKKRLFGLFSEKPEDAKLIKTLWT